MNESSNKIVLLSCVSQNYEWGKFGSDSTVAKLLKGSCVGQVNENTPYAELWMGSHPSAPSKVGNLKLNEYIDIEQQQQQSSIRGDIVEKRFGKDHFPFLFKVLSIRTALSIQAHPDSTLAQTLFKKFPNIYKDPYHKPEIAIATTPFEALCSFRQLSEIQSFIDSIPEFKQSLPNLIKSDDCKEYLKNIVTLLLKADSTLISKNLKDLNERLEKKQDKDELDRLVMKLYCQYPGDVGVFFAYILNYLVLKPGEALFLGAGEPHAYISGDCVECMAPSDNVVRAGLTPKLKDVDTLAEMLTYTTGKPEFIVPQTRSDLPSSNNYLLYQPPVDEFQVEYYHLDSTTTSNITVHQSKGPSIVLVYSGKLSIQNLTNPSNSNNLQHLQTGSVLFVPSNTQYQFIQDDPSISVTIYVASVNNRVFNKNNL